MSPFALYFHDNFFGLIFWNRLFFNKNADINFRASRTKDWK